MTDYMATIRGPLPEGCAPQSDEASLIVETVMLIAETHDYDPVGSANGNTWSISVTVGSERSGEWLDAFDEALHLAVTISVDTGRQITGIEITSYDDPIFAGIE